MAKDMQHDAHTVWFRGKPYPVSAYPHSADEGGTVWYVLADDDWHPVRDRRGDEPQESGWTAIEVDVTAWLERNVGRAT